MTKPKAKPSFIEEWLGKLPDLLGETDPSLDHVKEFAENLRKQGKLGELAVNEYDEFEKKLKKDLNETVATEEQKNEILNTLRKKWDEKQEGPKQTEIMNSSELAKIDQFITEDVNKYEKLQGIIESSEPQAKWMVMLKGFASKIPGLDENVDKYFEPVLSALGLGFLVKLKPMKSKIKEIAEAGRKKSETAKGKKESDEVFKKPGNTLILGDSNNAAFDENLEGNKQNATKFKEAIDIDGEVKVLSKGSMQSIWLKNQLTNKPASYFEGIENGIVLTSSNDLGDGQVSADNIIKNLKSIYSTLKGHGIKVFACTLPPIEGHKDWMKNGKMEDGVVNKRNAVNKFIIESGLAHHVIRLDTEKGKDGSGGVADANGQIAKEFRRFGDDYVHVKGGRLAAIYERELKKQIST